MLRGSWPVQFSDQPISFPTIPINIAYYSLILNLNWSLALNMLNIIVKFNKYNNINILHIYKTNKL